ncbi:cell division protein FtsL [Acidaminococcus sp. BV3L6]|uniref:cell division protein FtsL n=1 Tax=Acidaminococcus sp. (strain BV3L6) TaxID=1111120 RepID=UPI000553C8CB|nr:cell division protein FtsL [Acidaminococcus sp. BV3L6]
MNESVVGDIAMLKNKHKVYGTFAYHTAYNYGNTATQEEPLYEVPFYEPAKKSRTRSKVASAASKKFVLSIVIMLILVAANTFLAKVVMDQSYNLIQMKKQEAALIDKNVTLRIDVSRLKSPNRIASIASKKLGLNTARENIYVNINVPPIK